MNSLPPQRPNLFGPVHPAHPPVDAPGILAWLVGSKEAGRRNKTLRRTAPALNPRSHNKQAPVLVKQTNKLAAFAKPLRGIFWGAAALAALGLIGALVWLLTSPPRPLPLPLPLPQAATSVSPIARTVKPDTATLPTPAPSAAGAAVEVANAPAASASASTAFGQTAVAPKLTNPGSGRTPKKPVPAPAVDSNATVEPVEPPDLDTQAIESILPHLPPMQPPEKDD